MFFLSRASDATLQEPPPGLPAEPVTSSRKPGGVGPIPTLRSDCIALGCAVTLPGLEPTLNSSLPAPSPFPLAVEINIQLVPPGLVLRKSNQVPAVLVPSMIAVGKPLEVTWRFAKGLGTLTPNAPLTSATPGESAIVCWLLT